MGMGRASGAMQNQMGGMGGKGGQQPQGGFRGKGGAQQTQGGFGGKGAGRFQPQQPPQPPQGGFSGKGGQQQNPYAQQYYQPQFQPEYFNNPYSQGGFGQQPQMGGFGGKGGQMRGMSDLQRLAPNMQGDDASYQDYVNRPTQEMKMSEAQFNAQRNGMPQYGIPEQQGGSYNRSNVPQYAPDVFRQLQGGMGGKGGNINQVGPDGRPLGAPGFSVFSGMNKMGGMGGKGGQMPRRDMGYGNGPRGVIKNYGNVLRGQQSGLAALAQPTATTQAATPAPEQPYMGNYMS
jgi:hypothetical protein